MTPTSVTPTIHKPQPLSRRKRFAFSTVVCLFFAVLFLLPAEIVLRRRVGPWIIDRPFRTTEPAGSYHSKHPTLGYMPKPGAFKFTLADHYSFIITQLPNGLRITHPLNTYPAKEKKEIWIFGCSLTQGWSLNDEETYPWLLQKTFKDYEVVNFGVDGYSTVQSLIQFREACKNRKKPALVILAYGSIHDHRNTGTRSWIKTRMTGGAGYALTDVRIPYMKLSGGNDLELFYSALQYRAVPLSRYSALANALDETYNRLLERTYHSHEVSKAIIEEFFKLSSLNEIPFVVAGIWADPATAEMLDHCGKRGMKTVDISVDLSSKQNTNLPHDNHPSAIANRQYAHKLQSFLCSGLIDGPPCDKL